MGAEPDIDDEDLAMAAHVEEVASDEDEDEDEGEEDEDEGEEDEDEDVDVDVDESSELEEEASDDEVDADVGDDEAEGEESEEDGGDEVGVDDDEEGEDDGEDDNGDDEVVAAASDSEEERDPEEEEMQGKRKKNAKKSGELRVEGLIIDDEMFLLDRGEGVVYSTERSGTGKLVKVQRCLLLPYWELRGDLHSDTNPLAAKHDAPALLLGSDSSSADDRHQQRCNAITWPRSQCRDRAADL